MATTPSITFARRAIKKHKPTKAALGLKIGEEFFQVPMTADVIQKENHLVLKVNAFTDLFKISKDKKSLVYVGDTADARSEFGESSEIKLGNLDKEKLAQVAKLLGVDEIDPSWIITKPRAKRGSRKASTASGGSQVGNGRRGRRKAGSSA